MANNATTVTILTFLVVLAFSTVIATTPLPNLKFNTTLPSGANNTQHYDLPVSTPPSDLALEQLLLFSRHGNRANDPIIEQLCPKRKPLTELYHQQQAYFGAMTFNGIKSLWDLGKFTNYQYVQPGFISGQYNRVTSQIIAAQSDRTIISAQAWGMTTFNEPYAGTPFAIPVAALSVPPEHDDLLEVRKARCAGRLSQDLENFDQNVAPKYIAEHQELLDYVSEKVCGIDIKTVPALTKNEFSVMQMVKDIADVLTGDVLEDFPAMIDSNVRLTFLQFAEDIFKQRHYGTPEMNAYLAGSVPSRLIKLIDRRVSFLTNSTILDSTPSPTERGSVTYRDIVVNDAKRLPVIPPRPPRKLFAFHAHREVLYAFKNLLNLDVGVEREGILPTGLIHPSTGIFFELYRNTTKFDELLKTAEEEQILPVLNPNRGNSQRFIHSIVDDAFSIRILLWVPCFDGMAAVSAADGKTPIEFTKVDESTGETLCLARVRTLAQCNNQEFCPLSTFKTIIAQNLNAAGGDFRHHCPIVNGMEDSPDYSPQKPAKPFSNQPRKDTSLASFMPIAIEKQPVVEEDDSDSSNAEHQKLSIKQQKKVKNHGKKHIMTYGAGFFSNQPSETDYNTKSKSMWFDSLANFPSAQKKHKE